MDDIEWLSVDFEQGLFVPPLEKKETQDAMTSSATTTTTTTAAMDLCSKTVLPDCSMSHMYTDPKLCKEPVRAPRAGIFSKMPALGGSFVELSQWLLSHSTEMLSKGKCARHEFDERMTNIPTLVKEALPNAKQPRCLTRDAMQFAIDWKKSNMHWGFKLDGFKVTVLLHKSTECIYMVNRSQKVITIPCNGLSSAMKRLHNEQLMPFCANGEGIHTLMFEAEFMGDKQCPRIWVFDLLRVNSILTFDWPVAWRIKMYHILLHWMNMPNLLIPKPWFDFQALTQYVQEPAMTLHGILPDVEEAVDGLILMPLSGPLIVYKLKVHQTIDLMAQDRALLTSPLTTGTEHFLDQYVNPRIAQELLNDMTVWRRSAEHSHVHSTPIVHLRWVGAKKMFELDPVRFTPPTSSCAYKWLQVHTSSTAMTAEQAMRVLFDAIMSADNTPVSFVLHLIVLNVEQDKISFGVDQPASSAPHVDLKQLLHVDMEQVVRSSSSASSSLSTKEVCECRLDVDRQVLVVERVRPDRTRANALWVLIETLLAYNAPGIKELIAFVLNVLRTSGKALPAIFNVAQDKMDDKKTEVSADDRATLVIETKREAPDLLAIDSVLQTPLATARESKKARAPAKRKHAPSADQNTDAGSRREPQPAATPVTTESPAPVQPKRRRKTTKSSKDATVAEIVQPASTAATPSHTGAPSLASLSTMTDTNQSAAPTNAEAAPQTTTTTLVGGSSSSTSAVTSEPSATKRKRTSKNSEDGGTKSVSKKQPKRTKLNVLVHVPPESMVMSADIGTVVGKFFAHGIATTRIVLPEAKKRFITGDKLESHFSSVRAALRSPETQLPIFEDELVNDIMLVCWICIYRTTFERMPVQQQYIGKVTILSMLNAWRMIFADDPSFTFVKLKQGTTITVEQLKQVCCELALLMMATFWDEFFVRAGFAEMPSVGVPAVFFAKDNPQRPILTWLLSQHKPDTKCASEAHGRLFHMLRHISVHKPFLVYMQECKKSMTAEQFARGTIWIEFCGKWLSRFLGGIDTNLNMLSIAAFQTVSSKSKE